MSKIAVFVEGQSELIFVRDLLSKHFNYDPSELAIDCYKLHSESVFSVPYSLGNAKSRHYYMILNVGNDEKVLTAIISRAKGLLDKGYDRIIGLRDIYSRRYRDLCDEPGIYPDVIESLIKGTRKQIHDKGLDDKVSFMFSVMEFETWYLGMPQCLLRKDKRLTIKNINDTLKINLNDDPQITIFHPAITLNDILNIVGLKYDKKESDVESLNSSLFIEDYLGLVNSGHCTSFFEFYKELTRL